ncbi:MAG: ABC transporter permease [Flavobacteriales bacterium]|nr:ABC transporter permease [Flavobacteriales bacterium]MBP7156692.1 ABC transporter permease [Flavobacteriales bacterium]HQV76294.1 ABC transporter permease [Flavobacteriales bacterium]HQW41928.1 ABC transporter permease [Flavobacteriales bacterium]
MRLLIDIAVTLLRAKLRQSIIAAVGVMFSIAMFVTLLGFMNGLNQLLDGLILNRTPHVRLYNELKVSDLQPIDLVHPMDTNTTNGGSYNMIRSVKPKDELPRLRNATAIMEALEKDDRVMSVSPRLVAQVLFNIGTTDLTGVVNGVEVMKEVQYYKFQDYLVKGDPYDLASGNNTIVLGKGLADLMEAKVGDLVQVTTATGDRSMLRVVGYFQTGVADYDKVQCYANIKTVQKLLARPGSYYTDINVKLHDLTNAPTLAREFASRFGVQAVDIQTANAQFETGSDVRNIISYAVGVVLLVVAGFGIYNILNMMIYEKLDAIAILKATGFNGSDVQRIFLLLSIIIGVVGGLGGLVFGFTLQKVIDNIPFNTEALPTVKTYPIDYSLEYYVIAVSFALLTTWVAGWFPARKASQVDPVEIIRGK